MKKKLNLYCLMFILAVGFGVAVDFVTGFNDMRNSFVEGWKDGNADWGKEVPYKYKDVHVTFRTKSFSVDNATSKDSIYNENTKEKEAISYNSITMQVPKDKAQSSTSTDVLIGIGSILVAIGCLGFWVVFFLAIRSVKRGDVFLSSVASYLNKAAIFLLLVYVGEWVLTWAHYEYVKEMVDIANYDIVPNFEYCNSDLYIAFGLLLLAQIIKHGKELKEEQELTI